MRKKNANYYVWIALVVFLRIVLRATTTDYSKSSYNTSNYNYSKYNYPVSNYNYNNYKYDYTTSSDDYKIDVSSSIKTYEGITYEEGIYDHDDKELYMEELSEWLSDYRVLNHKLAEIEYVKAYKYNIVSSTDYSICLVYRYKDTKDGDWLVGIVSEHGIFSEYDKYNEKTLDENVMRIVKKLMDYWEYGDDSIESDVNKSV